MRKQFVGYIVSMCIVFAGLATSQFLLADEAKMVEAGKKLALSRKKGNCLACHAFDGAQQAGTMAPPLVAMKYRFPNKADIKMRIWDATKVDPTSQMPPFGRNMILTDEEIDQIVAFVSTL